MNLKQKTFILVTGASRGIGKAIALELARKIEQAGSVIVVMGRNQNDLESVKALIENEHKKTLVVRTEILDLCIAVTSDFSRIISDALQTANPKDFERAIIIHNAGTVGDLTQYARNVGDIEKWQNFYRENFFSATALNSEFQKVFADVPKVVVNVTSLCAIQPFVSMTYYCSVKAAREMYFRVLAAEEQADQTLVLNYAPGAIDTAMTMHVQKVSHNKDLVDRFRNDRANKTMLKPEQTAIKLVKVLEEQKFKSGDHVDYHDA